MSVSNGLVSAPITIAEMYSLLGLGTAQSNGAHDLAYLCGNSHGKICKWSRCKPVRGTNPFGTDFDPGTGTTPGNATDKTGIYAGNRGQAAGKPIYWGMEYPMNTAEQNYCRKATGNLIQLCYDVVAMSGGNHSNFIYRPPVAGTDYSRLADFDGYRHNNAQFLDAGVAGAAAGINAKPATMSVNRYDDVNVPFYALIPADSVGWMFRYLIPEPNEYYFVVELYKTADYESVTGGDFSTKVPFAVFAPKTTLYATTGMGIRIEVPLSVIETLGGLTANNYNFIACVGFNRVKSSATKTDKGSYYQITPANAYAAANGAAFIAPYSLSAQRCVTKITVTKASPYIANMLQYALTTSTAYANFPSAETRISSDSLRFKVRFDNNANSTAYLDSQTQKAAGHITLRAIAYGSFDRIPQNMGYISEDDYSRSKPIPLKISDQPAASPEKNSWAMAAKSKTTLYAQANALIPYGTTSSIVIEVSNDGGKTWNTTGTVTAYFRRVY